MGAIVGCIAHVAIVKTRLAVDHAQVAIVQSLAGRLSMSQQLTPDFQRDINHIVWALELPVSRQQIVEENAARKVALHNHVEKNQVH